MIEDYSRQPIAHLSDRRLQSSTTVVHSWWWESQKICNFFLVMSSWLSAVHSLGQSSWLSVIHFLWCSSQLSVVYSCEWSRWLYAVHPRWWFSQLYAAYSSWCSSWLDGCGSSLVIIQLSPFFSWCSSSNLRFYILVYLYYPTTCLRFSAMKTVI